MVKTALSLVLVALVSSGCATCARYPTACGVVTAVAIGSVAATIAVNSHGHGDQAALGAAHSHTGIGGPTCATPSSCQ